MEFVDILQNGKLWAVVYDGEEQDILSKTFGNWMDPGYLDDLFRPLENQRIHEMLLSREKAKGKRSSTHNSWLRIYAIKLDEGIYLVTGGAIKLTHLMAEREHTLNELRKMEMVRNYLLDNGVRDADGIKEDLL